MLDKSIDAKLIMPLFNVLSQAGGGADLSFELFTEVEPALERLGVPLEEGLKSSPAQYRLGETAWSRMLIGRWGPLPIDPSPRSVSQRPIVPSAVPLRHALAMAKWSVFVS
jgi:hypothetical protein